jgi:EAL domain-containing protein (putative c-di-GMP-specific phosphodiesterase class I)
MNRARSPRKVASRSTVAEGVESAETAAALRDYGCEIAQGFYYSPPITAPAVLDLLGRTWRTREGRGC